MLNIPVILDLLISIILFSTKVSYVRGDDTLSDELNTCNDECNPKYNAKLNREIPEYCDTVEKRCTSCVEQCQLNRRITVNTKCLCYCQQYYPGFGSYRLQFTCPDEPLALDTVEDPIADHQTWVGTPWVIVASLVGVAVIVLAIIFLIKRLKNNHHGPSRSADEESPGTTSNSSDTLIPSAHGQHSHGPIVQEDGTQKYNRYQSVPSQENYCLRPQDQLDDTIVKDVIGPGQSPEVLPDTGAGLAVQVSDDPEDYKNLRAVPDDQIRTQPVDRSVGMDEKVPNDKLQNPEIDYAALLLATKS